ncbi:FimV/HubP family polar landmark protein [Piscinibacter sakaiensis]|uniref:FimV/HubP family polar landmark protein n=1 Tax=Piscinibacter sakaiensis TaxID=1547922 RepID=UPI003AAF05D6
MKTDRPDHRHTVLAASIAAALLLGAAGAQALTLGKAVVQSSLGERMRAEIEFENLTAAEAASLRASIASADQYRQAGATYNANLGNARVVLQRIANRRASLLVTTDRPIQEPFVDVVLDLTWAGGQLVRTYTLLLDPPGMPRPPRSATLTPYTGPSGLAAPSTSGPPIAVAPPAPAAPPAAPQSTPAPRVAEAPVRAAPSPAPAKAESPPAPAPRRGPPPPGAPPAPPLIDDPYRVRTGDTLSEVAQRGVRPGGISLDRLVLAMYRDNPDAFVDGNIHKLRQGVVLSPAKQSTIDSITDSEARQVIKAQSVDFDAYRSQLAEAPRQTPEATRSASGRIDADVQVREKPKSASPDILTLSKPQAASAPVDAAVQQAAQREREQAAARVAELSKNVQDLARLSSEAASQPAAAGAAGAGQAPADTAPTVALSDGAASAPVDAASEPAAPADSASMPAVTVAAAPPVAPPQPAAADPTPMDSLLDDNLPVVGLAGLLVALLAGFGIFRLVKRRREAVPETSFLESRLKPDSFFNTSGGERVDTSEVPATGTGSSMMAYSLSQLDAIGDVDPVAEADVYMAYGRDMQAEEILKEAMRTNPERMAIRSKLLEVYAKRRDTKGYEALALELFALTEGVGADWEHARQLGRQLDPDNPLYSDAGPVSGQGAADDEPSPPSGLDVATMPLSVLPGQREPDSKIDFELDLDLSGDAGADATRPVELSPTPGDTTPSSDAGQAPPKADDMFSFTTSSFGTGQGGSDAPGGPDDDATVAAPAPAPGADKPVKKESDPFSLSDFSLDLELPEPSSLSTGPSMLPPIDDGAAKDSGEPSDFDPDSGLDEGDPLARKLELADEFRQIGDVDGARELLQEVIDGADGTLKAKAQAMLANLS